MSGVSNSGISMKHNYNRIIFRFIAAISLLFIISSCHTLKVSKPEENYLPSKYLPDYSVINVPVETSTKEVEKLINKRFSGLIYSDNSFDDNDHDNLMMNAWTTFHQLPFWAKRHLSAIRSGSGR